MPGNMFLEPEAFGVQAGNVSPRTIKALQNGKLRCEVCGVEVRTLGVGDSFGEVAVFAYRTWILHREHAEHLGNATALESLLTRTADVVCVEQSVLLELTVQDIDALFRTCPRLVYNMWQLGMGQLRQCAVEGSEQAQSALSTIAGLHPLLAAGWLHEVSSEDVLRIIEDIRPDELPARHFTPGDHIMRQGKLGDSAFLVRSGLYSCQVDGAEVRQFGPWSAFGEVGVCARFPGMVYRCLPAGTSMERLEEAIRNGRARQADVVCIEEGDILEVPCDVLARAFAASHKVFANMFTKVQDRFLETIAFACNDAKTALACLRQPRSESPMRLMDTRGKTESPPPKGRYVNPRRAARVRPESGDPAAAAAAAAEAAAGGGGGEADEAGGGPALPRARRVASASALLSVSAAAVGFVGDVPAGAADSPGRTSPISRTSSTAAAAAAAAAVMGASADGAAAGNQLTRTPSDVVRLARRAQRMNWD